jgi:hypothetical protein
VLTLLDPLGNVMVARDVGTCFLKIGARIADKIPPYPPTGEFGGLTLDRLFTPGSTCRSVEKSLHVEATTRRNNDAAFPSLIASAGCVGSVSGGTSVWVYVQHFKRGTKLLFGTKSVVRAPLLGSWDIHARDRRLHVRHCRNTR